MIMPIVKKEFRSYYSSPIAYIIMTFFLILVSVLFFFFQNFFSRDVASLRSFFGTMPLIFVFLIPALTMRSWAEEKKTGSYEILISLPYRNYELVLGKYIAAMLLLTIMMILTLPVPLSVSIFGYFEWGEIIGEYLGMLLLASASIAVGIFVSSLSRNQISAFILSVLCLLFFTLIGNVTNLVELPQWLANIFRYLSFDVHYDSLLKGLIDSRDIGYYVLITSVSLYGTMKVLQSQKER